MRGVVMLGLGTVWIMLVTATASFGYEVVAVPDGGRLTGTVKFTGTRPPVEAVIISKDQDVCGKTEKVKESLILGANLGVQNAVVSLTNVQRGKPFSSTRVTVDQRECRYAPHVLLVPVDGTVAIVNSDGILHNIRSHSSKNLPMNKAQPKFKKMMKEVFHLPEVIQITCDAHAWMSGWLIIEAHPYYAVTDANGRFQLEDIPPGEYEVQVWHESLSERTQRVRISPKTTTDVSIEFMIP